MPACEPAELTVQERGILATSASAAYVDHFSDVDRVLVSGGPPPALVSRCRTYYSGGRAYSITWQDHGQPLPAWFDPVMQGFADLFTLPPDWDSYGAMPIEPSLINRAIAFVNGILTATSPAPRVVPLSDGGIQLEWRRMGIDLEVVFDRNEAYFYHRNRANGEEGEGALPDERASLRTLLKSLE